MKKTILLLALVLTPMSFAQMGTNTTTRPQGNGEMRQKMKAKMLEKFDADNDGELSDSERAAAKEARQSSGNSTPRQNRAGGPQGKNGAGKMGGMNKSKMRERILKKFDADGDGKLNERERATAKEAREELISKYDKNDDGKLGARERKVLQNVRSNKNSK